MNIQRISAFSNDEIGGNPAGVVLLDVLPAIQIMQEVAKNVGYSETAFAAKEGDIFRVRYFAPSMEVPFCGHATIALGAALGQAYGAGTYDLALNKTNISVEAYQIEGVWNSKLRSPETSQSKLPTETLSAVLALFDWTDDDLGDIHPTYANAGADHILLFLKYKSKLENMEYDFEQGRKIMNDLGLITINCLWRENEMLFHSRNAFASGGVVEDPATGAAAAALGGYLRDGNIFSDPFSVIQGEDMGCPSRLEVEALPQKNASIFVSGQTRVISTP